MKTKTIIVVSGQVDATIKEYQPDVDFRIFKTVEELGNYLDRNPIRAQTLFFTQDVIGGVNSTFTYMRKLTEDNDYLSVDKIVYITKEEAEELDSLHYLIDEYNLSNWEIITGSMTRAFISGIINGTFRDDKMNVKHKAVYRRPRADYVKSQLKKHDSLDEEYTDDEHDLQDIPDEDMVMEPIPEREEHLQYVYVAGNPSLERSAFTFLAAQYLSLTDRTLLVESDANYHMITEFSTKSEVEATRVSVTQIYEDPAKAIEIIRNAEHNLVIIECIDRIDFDYRYLSSLLYYNLMSDFTYILSEISLDEITSNHVTTVVVPSTVLGTLSTGELVDKSVLNKCRFIGVNLQQLPEIHINSGVVMSTLLSDIMSTSDLICPVITITSLRLNGTAYDLGGVLGRSSIL